MDQPTQHIPRTNPGEGATERIPTTGYPPQPPGPPGPPPPTQIPGKPAKRPIWRDPLSIVLIVVIVFALVAAGVAGGEIFARNRADTKVAAAINCVTKDQNGSPDVSFAALPPFLWQHMTGDYQGINIVTEGNIRGAQGMKLDISIDDVRLEGGKYGAGKIGPIGATVTWPTDGIKQTLQQAPLIGTFVSDVKSSGADGTITLLGPFGAGSVVTKPTVAVDSATNTKKLTLKLQNLSALGFALPPETIQGLLDGLTDQLANSYPLNVRPDAVKVTDTSVVAQFSSPGDDIPAENLDPDGCFKNL